MNKNFTRSRTLPDSSLWKKLQKGRGPASFELEITARCNHNCRHCYINLPANDRVAEKKELSFKQIKKIADEAFSMGALWCLITGGEPLLRKDFEKVYLYLKEKGFLVSVFTNATLVNKSHMDLFLKYPPRDIEVTVYGVTEAVYERVTRVPGSFKAFMKGIDLLLKSGIKIRFKAMALRSNVHELSEIAAFCRQRTKDYFRFDPLLHLRFDGNAKRNEEIKSERLPAQEIVRIEQADSERADSLQKNCHRLIFSGSCEENHCTHLFHCGAGDGNFSISYDGFFRLCSSLWHPDCLYDLKKGTLAEACGNFVLKVRDKRSDKEVFLQKCKKCRIVNLCLWCPAHGYLETGEMDEPVDYFCEVAHARAKAILTRKEKL